MEIAHELRHAAARMLKAPGLPLGAVLAIGIGLGGAVAVFRVIDVALFSPLELQQANGVFVVTERRASGEVFERISPDELSGLRSPDSPFESVAAVTTDTVTMTAPGEATEVRIGLVAPALFQLFRVRPRAGRSLVDDDASNRSGEVVVVGETFWDRHFPGQSLGNQQIVLGGRPATIVGVIPAAFGFPSGAELWRPLPSSYLVPNRVHYLVVVVRRRPAAADEIVSTFLSVANTRIAGRAGSGGHVLAATPFVDAALGTARQTLIMLGVAVVALLVLTATSVATLLVARAWGRRGDYGVKAALGATQFRLLREPLCESFVLAAPAAFLALGIAHLALQVVEALAVDRLRVLDGIGLDAGSAWVAAGLAALVTFLAGVVPALTIVARVGRMRGMIVPETGRRRIAHALVAVQVALAVVLATAAGLFAKSFYRVSAVNTGIAVDEVVIWRVALPPNRYAGPAVAEFYRSVFDRLGALPQVRSVSAALGLPFNFTGVAASRSATSRPDDPEARVRVSANVVGPDYFSTMGIQLLAGRQFTETDIAGSPNVIAISASTARAVFGPLDPIGRQLAFDDALGRERATVVAVVRDTRTTRLSDGLLRQTFSPRLSSPRMAVMVRLRGVATPRDIQALRAAARQIDSQLPADFTRLADLRSDEVSLPVLRTGLLMAFASQAMLISAISVVGLARWRVTQRNRELALRVALGATPGMVRRLLLRTEMAWVLGGIATGAVFAFLTAPRLGAMLIFVNPRDPSMVASAVGLLSTIALLAVFPLANRIAVGPHAFVATGGDRRV
jgi:putative ABC transport system permease protein